MFTYFIRVDGSPTYSFLTALSGGIFNIVFDYIFIGQLHMGITGAALATFLGLLLSFIMGVVYFVTHPNFLHFTFRGLSIKEAFHSMVNGTSEFVNQLADCRSQPLSLTEVPYFSPEKTALLLFQSSCIYSSYVSEFILDFLWDYQTPPRICLRRQKFLCLSCFRKVRLSLLCDCTDHSLRMHLSAGTNWGIFLCISRQHSL